VLFYIFPTIRNVVNQFVSESPAFKYLLAVFGFNGVLFFALVWVVFSFSCLFAAVLFYFSPFPLPALVFQPQQHAAAPAA